MPPLKTPTPAIPFALALLICATETMASKSAAGPPADAVRITRIDAPDPAGIAGAVKGLNVPAKNGRHATGPAAVAPLPRHRYSWRDGDRTIAVTLEEDGPLSNRRPGKDSAVAALEYDGDAKPVFRSHSGTPMTLPGGILLRLDPAWSDAEVEKFFERNGIAYREALPLDYLPNGFFVETEPGIASLELANALAAQQGVEASSPNWQRQVQAK